MIIFADLDIPQMFYEVIQLHMVCSVFDKLLFDKVIPVSVARLDGEIGEELRKVVFVAYDGKTVLLKASREQCKKVESCLSDDVIAHVKKCSKQVFGKVIKWNYSVSDN